MDPAATEPHFADRLMQAVIDKRSAVVVGLDPHLALLPPEYADDVASGDRGRIAAAVRAFSLRVVDAVHDVVPAVKPQVAFFEQLGPDGYRVLEDIVRHARASGLLVISDAKRGDIGSTAAAYADYHIGIGPGRALPGVANLGADAITVNPYLGADSLAPFVAYAARGKGLFVLAKTSNPGSGDLQDRRLATDDRATDHRETVYQRAAAMAEAAGADLVGALGYSSIGIVVGATYSAEARLLRQRHPRLPFLVPGFGAQGARATDVAGCFDDRGLGAIVSSSRGILFAYRDPKYATTDGARWADATRQAAKDTTAEIAAALAAG